VYKEKINKPEPEVEKPVEEEKPTTGEGKQISLSLPEQSYKKKSQLTVSGTFPEKVMTKDEFFKFIINEGTIDNAIQLGDLWQTTINLGLGSDMPQFLRNLAKPNSIIRSRITKNTITFGDQQFDLNSQVMQYSLNKLKEPREGKASRLDELYYNYRRKIN
jgi:hypothetical protein